MVEERTANGHPDLGSGRICSERCKRNRPIGQTATAVMWTTVNGRSDSPARATMTSSTMKRLPSAGTVLTSYAEFIGWVISTIRG
jgi:hypothetical protein